MELDKCSQDLKETQKLLMKLAQDDMSQKFQFSNFSYSLPKYCFISVLYTNHFLNQKSRFQVQFNDLVKRSRVSSNRRSPVRNEIPPQAPQEIAGPIRSPVQSELPEPGFDFENDFTFGQVHETRPGPEKAIHHRVGATGEAGREPVDSADPTGRLRGQGELHHGQSGQAGEQVQGGERRVGGRAS